MAYHHGKYWLVSSYYGVLDFLKSQFSLPWQENPIAFFTFPQKITQGSVLVRVSFGLGE
jgi:hypothetical protein